MSKFDKYFQFPIAALRFGKPIDQVAHEEMETRLRAVIDYCIIGVGTAIVDRDNHEAIAAQCDRYARENSLKVDMQNEHIKRYFCGASTLVEMAVEKKASLAAKKLVLAVEKKAT